LHERFPQVPRLALTATADGPTRRDILERLSLQSGRLFVAGFNRPNIFYRVVPKDNPRKKLLQFLENEHLGESGIIYHLSRSKVEDTSHWLVDQGYAALPYHAGMSKKLREKNQDQFFKEEGVIMVATIAFGMGIDKPDVRFVAHMDLPKSMESYYQETGRAGRDGEKSTAWLAYGVGDVGKIINFIKQRYGPPTEIWKRVISPFGEPRQSNPTFVWRSHDIKLNKVTILEIRKFDDSRTVFPDTKHGAIRLYIAGGPPVFPIVTAHDIMSIDWAARSDHHLDNDLPALARTIRVQP